MSKKRNFWSIIHDMKRQYGNGISTCNMCCVEGCNYTVVGAGSCKRHLEVELNALTGNPAYTKELMGGLYHVQNAVGRMVTAILEENPDAEV